MIKFNFLLVLLTILLTSILVINRVKCSGSLTLKQYYECRNLVMIKQLDYKNRTIYEPNPNITNNILSDQFYQRLGLANMTFDQAISFMGRIYTEIEKLSKNASAARFLECVKTKYDYKDIIMTTIFRNETILAQAKRIVSAFIEKFKNNYSSRYKDTLASYFGQSGLPTLTDFFIKNEICLSRIMVYSSSIEAQFPGYSKYVDRDVKKMKIFIYNLKLSLFKKYKF